jgi:phosphate transport system substrate-binding protein
VERNALNRNRLVAVTLAVTAGATGGLASGAQASDANGSLTGAGSTLVAPLMTQWGQDFEGQNNVKITYGAVGSGAGISQISARTVDFGASDAPLSSEQAAACNGCVQIPWALTATGIAFHLDGVKTVKLSPRVVSQIFLGHVNKWNDKSIRKLNKGTKLPNLKITPVFRSDGSGDTYAFTDLLTRVSPAWKRGVGFGTQVSFPTGVGGKGNDGVTAIVSSTNGSISYISAAYIIAHGLGAAALQNNAGRFVFPNLKNIQAAASAVKRVPGNNEMHIVNPSKKLRKAYPLSTFTYAIVPRSSGKASLLSRFIQYAMTSGQKFGPALDFAHIPKVVLKAGEKTLTSLR